MDGLLLARSGLLSIKLCLNLGSITLAANSAHHVPDEEYRDKRHQKSGGEADNTGSNNVGIDGGICGDEHS